MTKSHKHTQPPDVRPIAGFPGYYYSPSTNEFWSRLLRGPHAKSPSWRPVKVQPGKGKSGNKRYPYIFLSVIGTPSKSPIRKHRLVRVLCHTLAMHAMVGPRPQGRVVRHLDGSHLNWAYYDAQGKPRMEYRGYDGLTRGTNNPRAKLTEEAVRAIRSNPLGEGTAVLAKRYGVCINSIRRVALRETWGHVE
jgi:hypothetical protein